MRDDGHTVLILARTGTTKFLGGLFRGVNSCLGGLHHNIFGWIVLRCVMMDGLYKFWRELALPNFGVHCFEE